MLCSGPSGVDPRDIGTRCPSGSVCTTSCMPSAGRNVWYRSCWKPCMQTEDYCSAYCRREDSFALPRRFTLHRRFSQLKARHWYAGRALLRSNFRSNNFLRLSFPDNCKFTRALRQLPGCTARRSSCFALVVMVSFRWFWSSKRTQDGKLGRVEGQLGRLFARTCGAHIQQAVKAENEAYQEVEHLAHDMSQCRSKIGGWHLAAKVQLCQHWPACERVKQHRSSLGDTGATLSGARDNGCDLQDEVGIIRCKDAPVLRACLHSCLHTCRMLCTTWRKQQTDWHRGRQRRQKRNKTKHRDSQPKRPPSGTTHRKSTALDRKIQSARCVTL